jgi:hypothetical protein
LEQSGSQSKSASGRHIQNSSLRFGRMNARNRTPLELQLITPFDVERGDGLPVPMSIERLEGPIVARPLSMPAPQSRLRYFLDGSQRTFDHYIPGYFPIVSSVAAAGVLQRDAAGNASLVKGTLRLQHTWFVPTRAPKMPPLVEQILDQHMTIVDPLKRYEDDEELYATALADYNRVISLAYDEAMNARGDLEVEVLCNWSQSPERDDDPDWIVVDGALRLCVPRSVGLVKSFTRQHLTGNEATTLFDLPVGHRTSAFRATDKYRSPDDLDGLGENVMLRTLWYMRLHDATDKDARHGLIRIETSPRVTEPKEIDELSCWLLNEKRPRASADARWANLLYPVHFLERILKQYVDRHYGSIARTVR